MLALPPSERVSRLLAAKLTLPKTPKAVQGFLTEPKAVSFNFSWRTLLASRCCRKLIYNCVDRVTFGRWITSTQWLKAEGTAGSTICGPCVCLVIVRRPQSSNHGLSFHRPQEQKQHHSIRLKERVQSRENKAISVERSSRPEKNTH